MTDRYRLVWSDGLCRHGCGEPLTDRRNRFVNGHDSKLLDILLDAHKTGQSIVVAASPRGEGTSIPAQNYANFAFFHAGYRWFLVKAGIEDAAYDEVPGVEDPDSRNLYMGSESDSRPAVSTDERDALLDEADRALAEMAERIKDLEDGLAVALGAPLSDEQVYRRLNARLRVAAESLRGSRYDGASRDVWALMAVFSPGATDPVIADAGRAVLGYRKDA